MNPDFRALCAELIDALDGWHQAVLETGSGCVKPDEACLLDRARAALAAPDGPAVPEGREPASVVEELSDEELLELIPEGFTAPASVAAAIQANVLIFARAVLARYGHHSPDATKMVSDAYQMGRRDASADSQQAAEAAEGDVAELVAWLRMQGEAQKPGPNSLLSDRTKKERHAAGVKLTRAADLVEQRHPAPVPVAERLPGPEDCDGEERCWLLVPRWILPPFELTHWLPANALLLPAGEVK